MTHSRDYEARRLAQQALNWTKAGRESRARSRRRLDEVEEDVLLLSLLCRTLLDVLIERGDTSLADVARRMEELDELDGVTDGGLAVRALARDLGVEEAEIDKAAAFQRSLQAQEPDDAPSQARVAAFQGWLDRRARRRR